MKDFDELLDEILREDAAAEPRAGLEARVMAQVRADAGHGPAFRSGNGWRAWMLGPAAACLGIVAMVWYVSGGGLPQSDRVASHMSPPVLSVEKPGIENSHPVAGGNAGLSVGGSGRANYPRQQAGRGPRSRAARGPRSRAARGPRSRAARFSRDKAAPKMGYPALEDGPKLDTFPAVSQKGDVAGWLGSGDGGKLAAIARQVTPEVAKAYQQLQAVQSEPIDIAAIEIKPLQ